MTTIVVGRMNMFGHWLTSRSKHVTHQPWKLLDSGLHWVATKFIVIVVFFTAMRLRAEYD